MNAEDLNKLDPFSVGMKKLLVALDEAAEAEARELKELEDTFSPLCAFWTHVQDMPSRIPRSEMPHADKRPLRVHAPEGPPGATGKTRLKLVIVPGELVVVFEAACKGQVRVTPCAGFPRGLDLPPDVALAMLVEICAKLTEEEA
jgi:hypothetical protein